MTNSSDDPSIDFENTGVFALAEEEELTAEERARVIAGRYEILERIGEGGMGQVTLVRHRRLGKKFALKLMQAELSLAEEARAMFHREARMASAISHPNVVSIVDFGEDPDWGLFLVMELIEGELLSERLAAGRMEVEEACRVVGQLARALEAIHGSGIVHGDLKTENVVYLVGDDPSDWSVKLLDFGMAQLATVGRGHDATIAGTPEYMAPERIAGSKPQLSNDLYALGVILYELLVGQPPFVGEPRLILEQHLADQPEPVAAARGQVLDDRLVALVDKALAKEPGHRFASAGDLLSELRAYMAEVGMRDREHARRLFPERNDAAAAAFDSLSMPVAGINIDGTIVVANRAFLRVVQKDDAEAVEGTSIYQTVLARILPNLHDDLRLVSMTGKLVRRRVTVMRVNRDPSVLRLHMTPSSGACGACVLALHAIGREAGKEET